jgi:large subunit ribosomal protein L29
MKASELRQKSKEELESLLRQKKIQVEELRLALARKKTKNFQELIAEKKDIARILTILNDNS